MSTQQNQLLDNPTIFFAVFFTQLTAIIAQGSLRAGFIELLMQILIWGVMLGFSLIFSWTYLHKKNASKLPEQLTNAVAVIGIFAFLFQMLTSNLTSAILLMLSWLLVALSFSFKKQRNLYFSLLASMVLLLYAASISKSSSFIIYIVIYTLAAITALASNYHLGKTKQQISTTTVNTSFPFKLPVTALAGIILLLTAGIYLLVPRPSAINWGIFPAGGGHYYAPDRWPAGSHETSSGSEKEDLGSASNQTNDMFDKAMKRLEKSGVDSEALKRIKESGLKDKFNQAKKSALKGKLNELEEKMDQLEDQMEQKRDSSAFHYSGFENKIELNDQQNSTNNYNGLVLYMEGKEPQYLRGKVYDYFDGLSWKTTEQEKQRIDRKDNTFKVNGSQKGPFDLYTVTMAVDIAGEPNIYAPAATAEIQFPGNAIAKDNYGALFAPKRIDKNTFYSLKINKKGARLNGRPVDNVEEPTDAEYDRYTQLPDNITDRFIDFSRRISVGSNNTLEKASKIEDYLRKNYQYSLKSVYSSQGEIPLEEFLFQRPLGHCEYFATAMVTLMRAQEIPARLVTGFSVTTFNPVTGYYEARGLDAHAWAEVWVTDAGWVTFEATPPYTLPTPSETTNTSQSIEEYLKSRADSADLTEPESLNTKFIHLTKRAFEQLNMLLSKAWSSIKFAISSTGNFLLYYGWLVFLVLGGTYVALHYLRYFLVHKRVQKNLQKLKLEALQTRLEVAYVEMEKVFTLYKQPRKKEWTLHQYMIELNKSYPQLSDEITQISTTLNDFLYNENNEGHDVDSLSEQITEAINNVKTVTNYKFEIPLPAEKQIMALKEFINSFSIETLTSIGKKRNMQ